MFKENERLEKMFGFLISKEKLKEIIEFCGKFGIKKYSDIGRRGLDIILKNPTLLVRDTVELDYDILYALVLAFENSGITISGLPDGGAKRIGELLGEARIAEVRTE